MAWHEPYFPDKPRAGTREIVIDAAERMGVPTDPPPSEQFWRNLEAAHRGHN